MFLPMGSLYFNDVCALYVALAGLVVFCGADLENVLRVVVLRNRLIECTRMRTGAVTVINGC